MKNNIFGLAAALLLAASPVFAQFRPRPINDPATGETFHIEVGAGYWNPSADMTVASGGSGNLSGIPGSQIDAKQDLGFTDQRLPQLQLMLRPAKAHKLRLQYIPIKYEGSGTLKRSIDFNGQRYQIGVPVASVLDWKAYRFGYEFDFITKDRGFGGFIIEAKYTDVAVSLNTVNTTTRIEEFAHARAPIP